MGCDTCLRLSLGLPTQAASIQIKQQKPTRTQSRPPEIFTATDTQKQIDRRVSALERAHNSFDHRYFADALSLKCFVSGRLPFEPSI